MIAISSPSWSQVSPKDAAEAAFYYQTSGNYTGLVEAYDEKTISLLASTVDDLLEAHDKKPDGMVKTIFGSDDSSIIRMLGAKTLVSKFFAFMFGANLSEEERTLLRGATFEFVETNSVGDDLAEVKYIVAFTEEAKTAEKTMLLRRQEGTWFIMMKPELVQRIRAGLGLTTMQ
jgi:hypothetical protein